jgi:hypothetical protein
MRSRLAFEGRRFGRLTVITRASLERDRGRNIWICLCDCGNLTAASYELLTRSSVKSCGCYKLLFRAQQRLLCELGMIGRQFGEWTVLAYDRPGPTPYFTVRCSCGLTRSIRAAKLRKGRSKSCGCRGGALEKSVPKIASGPLEYRCRSCDAQCLYRKVRFNATFMCRPCRYRARDRRTTDDRPFPVKRNGRTDGIGSVYAVGDGRFIKIGWARNAKKRCVNHQVSNPLQLSIIAEFPGPVELEADVQNTLKAYHVRGEWFRDTPLVRRYLESLRQKERAA